MIATSRKARSAGAARKMASLVRHMERSVDKALGADEAANRIRRYVGEHDAPPDDRIAFERLCFVVFAQGIGYGVVMSKVTELRTAFADFEPKAVGGFTAPRMRALLKAPIVRNAAKIRACVENAKRWNAHTEANGSYLGRVASIAAADDAMHGWPSLANVVRDDFVRLGEPTARQTLKRWGFFTAVAHPGVRRCLERLGVIEPTIDDPALQRLVGSVAQRLGRDPYAVEAVLALFAGIGPCRKVPKCGSCELSDRCPHKNGAVELYARPPRPVVS